jgi:hypothetical protein
LDGLSVANITIPRAFDALVFDGIGAGKRRLWGLAAKL